MRRRAGAVTMLALLAAGCARTPPPVRPVAAPPKQIPVLLIAPPAPPARARRTAGASERCPSGVDIRRLRAARPKPLRNRPMPPTPAERVARTAAQLGQYEARGGWADQVEDMLARCDPS